MLMNRRRARWAPLLALLALLSGGLVTAPAADAAPPTITIEWTSLSAARHQACGTSVQGYLWCFGKEFAVQGGDVHTPALEVGTATNWASVSLGDFACARTTGAAL